VGGFWAAFFPSEMCIYFRLNAEKNDFVTATKSGTTNEFFVASTKNFAAATKRFVYRTKHFVVTKYFCYSYYNKSLCWYNKTFFFREGLPGVVIRERGSSKRFVFVYGPLNILVGFLSVSLILTRYKRFCYTNNVIC